ncbi:MOSC domain-containing protein [Planctomicrobium sp. SH668]|uniref:MOSC domain-containing protein n=1 Tax=Planctomicrobium sp. SH668 TaxID=3448126 RepID=UPI003F5BA264
MNIEIVSIQIGRAKMFDGVDDSGGDSKPWSSAIIKEQISSPVYVDYTNLVGDEQADRKHHGGVDKAILGYAARHYESWKQDLPDIPFSFGAFGENLTLDGVDESECCIGDVYSVGDCQLQISQPRQPCWKLSRRWNVPRLAIQVQKNGRTGWYYRVLQPGMIAPGMPVQLEDRPHPRFTVSFASSVMYANPRDRELDLELAACPALSESWKSTLGERALKGIEKDSGKRLYGR